jgi:hypothetical protein
MSLRETTQVTSTWIEAGVPGGALNPLMSTTTSGVPSQCRFCARSEDSAVLLAICTACGAVRAIEASRAALPATPEMLVDAIAIRPPSTIRPSREIITGATIANATGSEPRS